MSGVGNNLPLPASVSKNGWFTELETMWPGQKFSLALEEFSNQKSILFHAQSEYQEILVFRSAQYGNVLVLDGVIQITERDEFAYHEMMVHLPLMAHPNPKSICIVGGGDGGCLREVLRHSSVSRVVLVEIDPMVVQVARKYFATSTASHGFEDPRLTIVHEDAATYIGSRSSEFDVIMGDISDAVGPAESLFQPSFYESMYQALRPQGIICYQAECFWIHLDLISDLVACCSDIFDTAEYASTMVPTYPCGQIGFLLACKDRVNTVRYPAPRQDPGNQEDILSKLKWYSFAQHNAAFILPPFVEQRLEQNFEDPKAALDEEEEKEECFLLPSLRALFGISNAGSALVDAGEDPDDDD